MHDMWARIAQNLIDRVSGPMKFRLVLQPLMAIIFAVLDGRKDALAGRAPFFWGLITDPGHRKEMLESGWRSIGKVFILALVLDAVYQAIEIHRFYPGEALIVAFLLAILPYTALRGPAGRLFKRESGKKAEPELSAGGDTSHSGD